MKHRTKEEIEVMALGAFKRDLALLMESGLPVTPELVRAMARKSAEAQVEADLSTQPDAGSEGRSWLGRWFKK